MHEFKWCFWAGPAAWNKKISYHFPFYSYYSFWAHSLFCAFFHFISTSFQSIAHTETNSRTYYFDSILFISIMKWQITFNFIEEDEVCVCVWERMTNYTHFQNVGIYLFSNDHFISKILSEINQQIIDLNAIYIVQCHASTATLEQMPKICSWKKKTVMMCFE